MSDSISMEANARNPGWSRPLDPGFVIDADWLRRQLADRDPLWNDWHHNAPVMVRAAVELFAEAGRER